MADQPWYRDGTLRFAVGIEDTFVPQTAPGQRGIDEYDMMQHDRFWSRDLDLVVESGATQLRWGIPWYRVNPERGVWDWSWTDRVIGGMAERGIDLIADLVHYGTPLWLEGEFASPDYPALVAEYSAKVADRYRGTIAHYTPANEPLLNVMYCGEFGHWPPYLTGDGGFVEVLRGVSRGIVETQRAIADVDGDADFVHVEASFRFTGDVEAHQATYRHLRERAYLVQDLVMGRLGGDHALIPYLQRHGFDDNDLAWAQHNVAIPDVVGVNYYPQHSTERFEAGTTLTGGPGQLRPRVNAGVEGLTDVLRTFANRYGKPVYLTETGYIGTDAERISWLQESVAAVRELRTEGVDVVGYTWWSLTDMFEWTYRYGSGPLTDYQLAMGLWALRPDADGVLEREETAAAAAFRALATG